VLNASCDLQAAKDRSAQLQEQLARRGTDLRDAKEQLANVQQELAGKCKEVTKGKQEQATLQSSHDATLQASTHCA
jgi:septal ring factor EnvC (AmiA/AmiB activator)